MAIVTYPLNNIDFSAEDVGMYSATRTSGVYSDGDFSFSVSGADNIISVDPGIAWMHLNRFYGVAVAVKERIDIDLGLPDSFYPRIDAVALQFDANKNGTNVVVIPGIASSVPSPPALSQTEAIYQLHLAHVLRTPGAVSVSMSDVTDMRLDPNYCGIMADSVTKVDTAAINAQFSALLARIADELSDLEAGSAVELKKKLFFDVTVEPSAFVAGSPYDDFPLIGTIPLDGVFFEMIPEVVFALKDAVGGTFAPVAACYDGGVYIYAADVPADDVIIPTIICWRGA